MFNSVAAKYDIANDLLSFGMHRVWKKKFVSEISTTTKHSFDVLDCATGTGDIAILLQKTFPKAKVTGIDFSEAMLDQAPEKAKREGFKDIKFLAADILDLPFSENSFDHITVSFGVRNVENLLGAIAEFERVLRPGGTLHVLEFGQPLSYKWGKVYGTYHKKVLPVVGGLITGNMRAYSYLNKSSEEFPSGQDFAKQFTSTAWDVSEVTPLMGGIAYIYRIFKKS